MKIGNLVTKLHSQIKSGNINEFNNILNNSNLSKEELFDILDERLDRLYNSLLEDFSSSTQDFLSKKIDELCTIQDALYEITNTEDNSNSLKLNEYSLSKLKSCLKNGYMCVSAFRTEGEEIGDNSKGLVTHDYNLKQHEKLKTELQNKGLDFIETEGVWNGVEELSLFVPYDKSIITESKFKDLALELCNLFNQWCVLYKLPSEEHPWLIEADGHKSYVSKNITFDPKKIIQNMKLQSFTRLSTNKGKKSFIIGDPVYINHLGELHKLVDGHLVKIQENAKPDFFACLNTSNSAKKTLKSKGLII